MAVDKLVDSTQLDADLTSVANAIRTKGGTSAQLAFPADFVQAIADIPAGGGDYTAEDFADPTKPTGEVMFSQATMQRAWFSYRTGVTKLYLPNWTGTGSSASDIFHGMTGLVYAVCPSAGRFYNNCFNSCSKLVGVDYNGGNIGSTVFFGTKLKYIVIRQTSGVAYLGNTNAFNSSPFASNGAGGTLYVPADLISTYEAATNWSTILGYANNQIKSIESTATDPDAPVDLTTHYIDGTPIPTE